MVLSGEGNMRVLPELIVAITVIAIGVFFSAMPKSSNPSAMIWLGRNSFPNSFPH